MVLRLGSSVGILSPICGVAPVAGRLSGRRPGRPEALGSSSSRRMGRRDEPGSARPGYSVRKKARIKLVTFSCKRYAASGPPPLGYVWGMLRDVLVVLLVLAKRSRRMEAKSLRATADSSCVKFALLRAGERT